MIYDSQGSSVGIKGALSGTYVFGAASRELKEKEEAEGAFAAPIALDGIAIIVNCNAALDNLSLEQVARIFSGEISNWAQIGGSDADIVLVNRDDASGTRGAFKDLCLDKGPER